MTLPSCLSGLRDDLEVQIIRGLEFLLERSERHSDYGFVDMKVKVLDGRDFDRDSSGALHVYHRDVIYGFAQGRAIESLAGHIRWLSEASLLPTRERERLKNRAKAVLVRTIEALEHHRDLHGGRVFFMALSTGGALCVDRAGHVRPWQPPPGRTLTEIFYFKGLLAAASVLEDRSLLGLADTLFQSIACDALAGKIVNDCQPMDPKNPVEAVPGRISQADRMLCLGGVSLGIEAGLPGYRELGACLFRSLIAGHLNLGQFEGLERGDFVEYVDESGRPWKDAAGRIWCDPGHAIEFIGLATKFLLAMRSAGLSGECPFSSSIGRFAEGHFGKLLGHFWEMGFNPDSGGICKSVDLVTRTPINRDMPWWSLPEGLRASVEVLVISHEEEAPLLCDMALQCHRAYSDHYVRRDFHCLPIQTRDGHGVVKDVIPAIPDADPLYHTGLSLIDVLRLLPKPPSH